MLGYSDWLVPLVLGVLGCCFVLLTRKRVSGTTLTGPWRWALAAVIAVSAAELLAARIAPQPAQLLKQLAATVTLCPAVSLLGAKRPQHHGWHFVVLTLLLVLSLPTLEALLRPERVADTSGVRAAFLVGLVGLGLLNALPTRFWLGSVLMAGAQLLLLFDFRAAAGTFAAWRGLGLYVLALAATSYAGSRRRGLRAPLDRLWLDFRDAYGLLWGLRLAEQFNGSARMYGWDLRLSWKGFVRPDAAPAGTLPEPENEPGLHQTLENLLRRFVSPSWIAERLPTQVD